MKKILAFLNVVLVMLLFSCSPYSKGGYEFDPGQTLSPEMLESVFATGTPEPEILETEAATKMEIDSSTEVYFTDSGAKYHLFRDCGSLANSENVKSCRLSENEKEECCKHCQKRAGIESPEE